MPAAGGSLPHSCRPLAWSFGNTMPPSGHLSPRMASGVSLPTPGVLRLAAAGVDMSLPTSGNQVSSIWRPLAPGDIMTSEILSMLHHNNVVKLLFAVQTPFALDLLLEVCDADLRSVLRRWDMTEAESQVGRFWWCAIVHSSTPICGVGALC